ncbi:MAG: hypothetical protein E5X15_18255 [Mesorhizobium sp.]|nr:MAG: hypothetical protein E5X15_18255 [Mesorhizobium sp.]
MRLSLTLELGDRETPPDFASRLSTRACRDDMREFCWDFAMDPRGIINGEPDAVLALADLSGVDGKRLLGEAFTRFGEKRQFRHKGQHLLQSSLVRNRVRMCPACMGEDIERLDCRLAARPHRRSMWLIRGMRTCDRHGMALAEVGKLDGPHVIHDASRAIADAIPRLQFLADAAVLRSPSKLELYVARRLEGTAPGSWLDGLPLYAALHLPLVTGAVALHGPTVALDDLSDDDAWACEAAGFEIVDKGAAGIRSFLDELQAPFRARRSSAGPKVMYGRLYDWLAHESEDRVYDPVRDIILEHAVETLPFGPGDTLFGRDVDARRLHSVHTAAQEFAMHPKRLRKALKKAGLAGKDSDSLIDNRVVADPEQVAALARDLKEAMNMTGARAYLNVPRPHDEALVQGGLIKPMIEKPRGNSGMHYTFRKADLDEFLERLLRKADPALSGDPAFETLLKAAKRCCCPVMAVVRLVLDGKLERVGRNPAERGFLSVLVDPGELREKTKLADHGGLSLRDVEHGLKASTDVVKALIERGHLPARTATNPVNRCPQTIVMPEDLAAFKETYVSLMNLAKERGDHFARIKKTLAAVGVKPIADPDEIGITLYLRSEIPPPVEPS